MDLPQLEGSAPVDSMLGLLQRGRGDGWTRAAAGGMGADLLACLAHEPRWDRQVEDRADYYATLAQRLDVAASEVVSAARDHGDWIVRDVLEAMARRGSVEASALVLGMEVDDDPPLASSRTGPSCSRVASPSATAPVADLLSAGWRFRFPEAVIHRLLTTTDPSEIAALRDAVEDPQTPGWHLALQALALRGDPAPLPAVEQILGQDEPGPARAAAFRYMQALPSEVSLPLAREWLPLPDGRGAAASSVLAHHADSTDANAVRNALADAVDYYTISDLVRALGRCPEAGPFPELDEIYVGSAYSLARARAVEAMATTDPDFPEKWAAECLWDCEPTVRAQGAKAAIQTPRIAARLADLAQDPHEDADVRAAAATN